jgi:hypothetical protein
VTSQPPTQGWQSNPSQPHGYGQPPPAHGSAYGPPPNRSNGLAIAALVLGIAACCFGLIPIVGLFAFPLAAVGLALGIFGIARASRGARAGKTMAITGTVLCVLGLVFAVIGVVIFTRAFGDRDSSPGQTAAAPTKEIHADDLDVRFGQFVADGNPSIESGKLPVTLTNKGNDSASFRVHLEAVDVAGKRIDDDTAYVPNLAPGQSTTTYMFVLITSNKLSDMKGATFRIVEVSKY